MGVASIWQVDESAFAPVEGEMGKEKVDGPAEVRGEEDPLQKLARRQEGAMHGLHLPRGQGGELGPVIQTSRRRLG
jgi:hypothetical protein